MKTPEALALWWLTSAHVDAETSLADCIRARDAEIRADERAKVLAELDANTRDGLNLISNARADERRRVAREAGDLVREGKYFDGCCAPELDALALAIYALAEAGK